jgi:hypothetical protein
MFKIAGGIILAFIGLYLLAIMLQLLPIAVIMAPDLFRATARTLTPTRETVYTVIFLAAGTALGLWLLARPALGSFRLWLNNGKPSWR